MSGIINRRRVVAIMIMAGTVMWLKNDVLVAQEKQMLPDPTQPYTGSVVPVSQKKTRQNTYFNLQSTLVSEGRTSAIINGRLLKVGQMIADARVVDIKPHTVTLMSNGKKRTIQLVTSRAVKARKTYD